ncbi:hypothetical protein HJC23_005514, partial [Cyclotella cryptica]
KTFNNPHRSPTPSPRLQHAPGTPLSGPSHYLVVAVVARTEQEPLAVKHFLRYHLGGVMISGTTICPDQPELQVNENKGGSKQNNISIECLIMMWLSFISAVIISLLFLLRATFSEGATYLYSKEGDSDASFPVIDYLLPDNETLADEENYEYMHPEFLYKPDSSPDFSPPPRVVEFYAPWCPHCKHFKPSFIKMANAVYAKQPKIKFHAVSCVAHSKLCKSQNVSGYPTVKLFREGSYIPIPVEHFNSLDAETILAELGFDSEGVQIDTGTIKSIRVRPPGKQNEMETKPQNIRTDKVDARKKNSKIASISHKPDSDTKLARVIPFRPHEVSDAWHDAATSFEFALKYSIYMSNGPMPEKEKKAFFEWLDLLSKSLPPQMDRTRQIVKHIIATKGLPELTQMIRAKFPPLKSEIWRTCTYGNNENGYTCGLWQLFHVVSVGVVEHNNHGDSIIPTRYASEVLRNYVENFFQCEVCRMNFLYMYDSCAFDGCHRLSGQPSTSEHDWRELPLWLWETHNDVNVRLMGERLDRDMQPKPNDWESQQARWPSLFSCPNCWREDKSWEEDEVFQHLHRVYWAGNPTHIKIPSSDEVLKNSYDRSRSWKVAGATFALILLLVWMLKSKQLLTRTGKRREKKI